MRFASAARPVATFLLLVLATAAGAADEPEAVYQKLHDATLAGRSDEMLRYASAAQRAELAAIPDRTTALKFLATMMPRSYAINRKQLGPDGKTARILATGAHTVQGQTQPMYGEINLRKEAGEWKVDQWTWTNDRPGEESAQAGAVQSPRAAAPARKAAPPKEPTLKREGGAKGECEFKAVMTEEDMARCRR